MTEKKTITLKRDLVKELELQAKKENRSFSNLMETAVISYLKPKTK